MSVIALVTAEAEDKVPGVRIRVAVSEIVKSDPEEKAVIDSAAVVVAIGRRTTLRAGNIVLDIAGTSAGDAGARLDYSLFAMGPTTDTRFDLVTVEYDTPLFIDDIHGKGKSTYRVVLMVSAEAVEPPRGPSLRDSSAWEPSPSTYCEFFVPRGTPAELRLLPLRGLIQSEFEAMRDTFQLMAPGRVNAYLFDRPSDEFPFDPRYGFSVDPAHNTVAALFTRDVCALDAGALTQVSLYRLWGYTPELLAVGASGCFEFGDYEVLQDRARGDSIPLDSMVRAIDFKRHKPEAAFHHAVSFVGWLIRTHGTSAFRDLYERATDLSLRRAVWAVYGKTLSELEADWLTYLRTRTFSPDELRHHAERAKYQRRYDEHIELLEGAIAASDTVVTKLYDDLGRAQAHLGRWDEALATFRRLAELRPDVGPDRWLATEVLRAKGDPLVWAPELASLAEADTADPRPLLRLGEIQYDQRRHDSAAVLWRRGLKHADGPRISIELLLRLGQYEEVRQRRPDSARFLFRGAKRIADRIVGETPSDPSGWMYAGEALLALDSLDAAFAHLQTAAYLADAVIDQGRIHRDLGICLERMGRRPEAIREYEHVLAIPAASPDQEAARRYINNGYKD